MSEHVLVTHLSENLKRQTQSSARVVEENERSLREKPRSMTCAAMANIVSAADSILVFSMFKSRTNTRSVAEFLEVLQVSIVNVVVRSSRVFLPLGWPLTTMHATAASLLQ